MSLGVMLPTTVRDVSAANVVEWARIADQGGLHSVWVIDRLVFPMLESVATLAAVAAVTSRVKLGTNVLIEPNREPTLLAAQLATVDAVSEGRLILGVGVGNRDDDFAASGREFHTRGQRLEHDVERLRQVWAGGSVVEGSGPTGPRPVHGTIPIIFGGTNERAMARAARLGDGYACVPRGLARHVEEFARFRELWAKHDRSDQPFLLANGYFCVDDSASHARERIAEYTRHYYGSRQRASGGTASDEEWDLVGPPEAIAEAAATYLALGADALVLAPALPDRRQIEALVGPIAELVRRFRSAA